MVAVFRDIFATKVDLGGVPVLCPASVAQGMAFVGPARHGNRTEQ